MLLEMIQNGEENFMIEKSEKEFLKRDLSLHQRVWELKCISKGFDLSQEHKKFIHRKMKIEQMVVAG